MLRRSSSCMIAAIRLVLTLVPPSANIIRIFYAPYRWPLSSKACCTRSMSCACSWLRWLRSARRRYGCKMYRERHSTLHTAHERYKYYPIGDRDFPKMKVWKRKRWILLIVGAGLTLTVIVVALLLWKKLNDSGCLGLLGLLTVTLPIIIKGGGVLSVKSKTEARRELLDNYRERLKT